MFCIWYLCLLPTYTDELHWHLKTENGQSTNSLESGSGRFDLISLDCRSEDVSEGLGIDQRMY
jgi:hypothetical protein